MNDKGISSFARIFRDLLKVFETAWHENKHNLFVLSSSSSLSGSLFLSKTDNFWRNKQQRTEHAKNTIIFHLNIDSIRNKFEMLDEIVKAFDIFLILKSKLDNIFPINQFSIRGYKVFRRDRNRFRGVWYYMLMKIFHVSL